MASMFLSTTLISMICLLRYSYAVVGEFGVSRMALRHRHRSRERLHCKKAEAIATKMATVCGNRKRNDEYGESMGVHVVCNLIAIGDGKVTIVKYMGSWHNFIV